MRVIGKPLHFEDRTGHMGSTDFDDIYDRMFYRVLQQGFQSTAHGVPDRQLVFIYDRGRRSRRISSYQSETLAPSAILEFACKVNRETNEIMALSLGTITLDKMPPIPMKNYLRKFGTWGSSLNRKFTASDSKEYRWTKGAIPEQEWTCFNAEGQIVAHYDLKPPDEHAYKTSGNAFVVEEGLLNVAVEILATLVIMRHIEKWRL